MGASRGKPMCRRYLIEGLLMTAQTNSILANSIRRRVLGLVLGGSVAFLAGCAVVPADTYAVGAPVVSTSAYYYDYGVPYYYPAPYYGSIYVGPRYVPAPPRFSGRGAHPGRYDGRRPGFNRPDRPRPPRVVAPRPPGAAPFRPPPGVHRGPPRSGPPMGARPRGGPPR